MSSELAFVIINPYTIAKSRTGGVIGRFLSRTGLDLVAARLFSPPDELVEDYIKIVRQYMAADPAAEPIVIGMINQEDTPLGSFPEVRRAVEGGVEGVGEGASVLGECEAAVRAAPVDTRAEPV